MPATQTAKLEWSDLWAAMKASPDAWIPTTDAMYWDMLEAVPPRAHYGGAFLVGEAERHNEDGQAVHACFKQVGDDYFARYMTVAQFKGGVK